MLYRVLDGDPAKLRAAADWWQVQHDTNSDPRNTGRIDQERVQSAGAHLAATAWQALRDPAAAPR